MLEFHMKYHHYYQLDSHQHEQISIRTKKKEKSTISIQQISSTRNSTRQVSMTAKTIISIY